MHALRVLTFREYASLDWFPQPVGFEFFDLVHFVEAAKALRGEPHGRHKGYVFANAWVHQTVESMCIALMVDPKGDPEIIKAQELMQATLEDWIPKILAAQEPDGYLQTAYTLDRKTRNPGSPMRRQDSF